MSTLKVICHICEEMCNTYSEVTEHLKKKHSCFVLAKCPVCLNPLMDYEALMRTKFHKRLMNCREKHQ
ncbi:unnamed protein product [Hymenolepis diminuta]|uniref:Uncharacterized protein n=1 Tax=Hymenolepis diminuta TaxID=6216 RepID=A0A564Y483_HYMDI|nr:unnamed protein product [Hymenolepis diminuta]